MTLHLTPRRRHLLGALGAAALLPASAAAQGFPTRPLRIIVPFAPGGAVDQVARLIAQEIGPRLGQPVVVENRTGAGGNIAFEAVARAEPDGYTLLMASPGVVINPSLYPNLTFDPATQLAPVALVGEVPSLMLCAPGFEATSAADFIARARARPGHYTFGSGGAGTTEHLGGELLKARAALDITHVPYRGGAPAMADLMAGRISIMFSNLAQSIGHVEGGRMRALGIASTARATALPNVPTIIEQGLPDFRVTVWWRVMAPAGMPPAVVARLNREIRDGVETGGIGPALARMHATAVAGPVEAFGERLAADRVMWSDLIRRANIRPDD